MAKNEFSIMRCKISLRFIQYCDYIDLVWDENGKYMGQWQDNMLDDAYIFIGVDPDNPLVDDLTPEQMKNAV